MAGRFDANPIFQWCGVETSKSEEITSSQIPENNTNNNVIDDRLEANKKISKSHNILTTDFRSLLQSVSSTTTVSGTHYDISEDYSEFFPFLKNPANNTYISRRVSDRACLNQQVTLSNERTVEINNASLNAATALKYPNQYNLINLKKNDTQSNIDYSNTSCDLGSDNSTNFTVKENQNISEGDLGNYASRWSAYYTMPKSHQELNSESQQTVTKMSGGPPHHPHGRQAPSPNTAWNHLQVPNYYPRQPQHAHMSNEHPLLHQPTWHTPTTEPVKSVSHSHLFNLEQMISERPYPRHSPGVDLTLQRNGSQNGELPTTPISLSVRDANKINSLSASAIEIQAVELTKSLSPSLKTGGPGAKCGSPMKSVLPMSPTIKCPVSPGISTSPAMHDTQDSPKTLKRPAKRMDSIIERLNPIVDKSEKSIGVIAGKVNVDQTQPQSDNRQEQGEREKTVQSSVIVQPSSSQDDNSNSSSVLNVPTPTNTRDEDVTSPFSNEDSMDSNKSRRKRKPSKTMRVSKDIGKIDLNMEENKITEEMVQMERRRSGSAPPGSPAAPARTRRKTSSESETITNIAAMVESTATNNNCSTSNKVDVIEVTKDCQNIRNDRLTVSRSVIKEKADVPCQAMTVENKERTESPVTVSTLGSVKQTDSNSFVEVENKLEEMFAGIADDVVETPITNVYEAEVELAKTGSAERLLNEEVEASTSHYNDSVTSTSNDLNTSHNCFQKRGRPKGVKSSQSSESTIEVSPKRKKANKKFKSNSEGSPGKSRNSKKNKGKNPSGGVIKRALMKSDAIKDIYTYDSGSNASSSKSRGPFVQIRGSRDSPISVSIINTPTNEEEPDKKSYKSKKYHDDTEYRHKVRSRGLHCSTLSTKYDAQTRDASWICVFCKRGPHATDPQLSGPSRFNANVIIPPPGDLFGPYIITTDSAEYQRRLDDPYDQQFRSKKVARVLAANASSKVVSKKCKRKYSESYDSRSSVEGNESGDIYLGITETKDKIYEVWAHEDCVVWSPGVYLIGPKIIGLEEAVWTSCNVVCNKCRYKGANLCCVKRGCACVVHYGCAIASEWHLNEANYQALCNTHKVP